MPPFRPISALILTLTVTSIGASSAQAHAEGRGPSTAEERARALKIASESEKDPLGVMAAEGGWFEKWIQDIPDIQFGPEAPARWIANAAKGDLRKVMQFQYTVSAVAYQIQHQVYDPKTLEEKLAIHQAALEGVLRAYESLLPKRAENKSEKMEEAIALRGKGELPAFVKSIFDKKR